MDEKGPLVTKFGHLDLDLNSLSTECSKSPVIVPSYYCPLCGTRVYSSTSRSGGKLNIYGGGQSGGLGNGSPPAGFRGGVLVGGLEDEVPQKLKRFCIYKDKSCHYVEGSTYCSCLMG